MQILTHDHFSKCVKMRKIILLTHIKSSYHKESTSSLRKDIENLKFFPLLVFGHVLNLHLLFPTLEIPSQSPLKLFRPSQL